MGSMYSSINICRQRCENRKKTIAYWINKGCSQSKAESLYYRYGVKG